MRPGGGINTPSSAAASSSSLSASPSVGRVPSSPWHSPVPYLFGGLAAMLGLIAFALLILACSYWKLSSHLDGEEERDPENGEEKSGDEMKPPHPVYEEKIVVIMAGDEKPTFLATPMTSRASSFGNTSTCSSSSSSFKETDKSEKLEKPIEEEEHTDEQEEVQNRAPQTSEATSQHQHQ